MLLAATATGAPIPPADIEKGIFWVTKKGTVLVYRLEEGKEQVNTITEVEETKGTFDITVARADHPGEHIEASQQGLKLIDSSDGKDGSYMLLKLPLRVGDEWVVNRNVEGLSKLKGKAKVVAVKATDVPAGRFQAVEVLWNYTVNDTPVKLRLWYAKDVGLIKSDADGRVTELKEVRLPR